MTEQRLFLVTSKQRPLYGRYAEVERGFAVVIPARSETEARDRVVRQRRSVVDVKEVGNR